MIPKAENCTKQNQLTAIQLSSHSFQDSLISRNSLLQASQFQDPALSPLTVAFPMATATLPVCLKTFFVISSILLASCTLSSKSYSSSSASIR